MSAWLAQPHKKVVTGQRIVRGKFFTVMGKSGNFVFSVGKLTVSRKVRETSDNMIWLICTIEG